MVKRLFFDDESWTKTASNIIEEASAFTKKLVENYPEYYAREIEAAIVSGVNCVILETILDKRDIKQTHCGHPHSAIVSSRDGTNWCSYCENEARKKRESKSPG